MTTETENPDSEFDAALLANIKAGLCTLTLLDNTKMRALATPFCSTIHGLRTPEWRIIDRRLQALRKSGLIYFNNKAWQVAK